MSDDAAEQALPDLAAIEADLGAVGRALSRLDEGTYGRCDVCAEMIADDDIAENPLVERCATHRSAATPSADRTVGAGFAQTAWGSGGVASN